MTKKREISDNAVGVTSYYPSVILRFGNLAEQRSVISEDMPEIVKKWKSKWCLPKVIREVRRLRKLEADASKESDGHRTAYIMSLGWMKFYEVHAFRKDRVFLRRVFGGT